MEGRQITATGPRRTERTRWNRREAAACQRTAERLKQCASERAAATRVGVPRWALRNWSRRQERIDLPASVVEFFESPDGLDFLQGMLVAAHLVFCEAGSCGTRRLCQDETFHPQTCLVAIEPLSDFILVEGYTDQLDSQTWTARTHQALQDLPVKVVQSTSDEGRSLIKHCRLGLGAHHSPDIFHIQRDVSRAFCGKTNGAVQREATKLRHAARETARLQAERDALGPTHTALFDTSTTWSAWPINTRSPKAVGS